MNVEKATDASGTMLQKHGDRPSAVILINGVGKFFLTHNVPGSLVLRRGIVKGKDYGKYIIESIKRHC